MKILFTGIYKSLHPFRWEDVPNFVVITGLNGSGKSQLLELVANRIQTPSKGHPHQAIIEDLIIQPHELTYLKGEWQLGGTGYVDLATYLNNMKQRYDALKNSRNQSYDQRGRREAAAFIEVARKVNKSSNEVTFEEFAKLFPTELNNDDMAMAGEIGNVFYNYRLSEMDLLLKKTDSEEIAHELGPKPWEVLRDILKQSNLQFTINDPSNIGLREGYHFKIFAKQTNEEIQFNNLSSGEKVLFSLVFYLFNSQNSKIPKLFLLDEPDAFLHPGMSYQFIKVMKEVLVDKYGVRVIMTTHSPSTVALTPDESIYQLTNRLDTAIRKISKDDALKLLTSFIPTLSIDYKNQRQVFVESPTDVIYYQNLHDRHQQGKHLDFKLYFISNRYGKSNCSEVYEIVDKIRISGNKTSYGIVDWDLINKPKDYIYVHGLNERYSVENFILDPIYIICLLIELNNAHDILAKTGLSRTFDQYSIGRELASSKLQDIVKVYFTQFEEKHSSFKYDSKRIAIEYLNNKSIEIPEWYLVSKGHDLFDKVKEVFTALKGITNTGELEKRLSTIAAKCYPFVPKSTITAIEEIGNYPQH